MPFRKNFGTLLSDLRRGEASLKRELAMLGNDIIRHAIAYLDDNGINFQGDLKKSIDKEVTQLIGAIKLRVFAAAKHAAPVHEGTVAHWPPRRPIEIWARKKLKITETEIKSVAFLIGRKISKVGTEARPFLIEALKMVESSIAERMSKAFIRGFDGQ